jgi:hypothetical protein
MRAVDNFQRDFSFCHAFEILMMEPAEKRLSELAGCDGAK